MLHLGFSMLSLAKQSDLSPLSPGNCPAVGVLLLASQKQNREGFSLWASQLKITPQVPKASLRLTRLTDPD